MTKHLISLEIAETFRLPSGTTGETFTIVNATKPNGTSWAGPDIAEVGSGAYELSFTPDTTGVWMAVIVPATSGDPPMTGMWQVVDTPTPIYTRKISGGIIAKDDVNELQIALEKAQTMLGLS